MSSVYTLLGLSELAAGQAQPEITVNENDATGLNLLIALKGKDTVTPPGSPAEGDAYIVGASPTGDWSAFTAGNIAVRQNGSWLELTPITNLLAVVIATAGQVDLWRWNGTAWEAVHDPDVVLANATRELTVGYRHAIYDHGTVSSGTVTLDESNGAMQKLTNGGAFALAPPPVNSTSIALLVTNNATAGAITTTGWTVMTGDPLTTVNGDKFILYGNRVDTETHLHVVALQ